MSRVESLYAPDGGEMLPGVRMKPLFDDGGGACRVLDVFQPVREDYRERFAGG